MDWIVNTKGQWEERQKYFEKLMDEKEKQISKLTFEVSALFFLHSYFKGQGWD